MEECPYVLDRSGSDLHEENENLRARGPVTQVELHGGYTAWSVTGYEVVDIKARFFYPLSTILVCDLLGIREEDQAAMLQGAQVNAKTDNTAEESEANLHQWHEALGRLVETKRREPGDDLTTIIIKA